MFGRDYQTLANYKWVAGQYSGRQFSLRGENLSWTHHKEVADLPPPERKELLAAAAPEAPDRPPRMTVAELRKEKRTRQRAANTPPLPPGKYRVLYADPPWKYNDERTGTAAEPSTEIAVEYKTCPEGIPRKLFAASFSVKHGDRLTGAEKQALACEVYEENPEYSQETVAKMLAVSQRQVSNYVRHILARKREQQKHAVLRLQRLGWTQGEIAGVLGITQGRVSQFLLEISELIELILSDAEAGFSLIDIAERRSLSLPLASSIALEGKTDAERMEALDIKVQPYDVWHFNACHDWFGGAYPGRIPGQLVGLAQ